MNDSLKDPNQIVRAEHDENNNSKRVTIVGGDFGISDAIQKSLKGLKLELPEHKQIVWPLEIEKEVVVKEYELLKIPEIITKYEKIQVPIITQEIKIVEIEKPIYITETKIVEVTKPNDNTKIMICFFIGQLIILALSKFL